MFFKFINLLYLTCIQSKVTFINTYCYDILECSKIHAMQLEDFTDTVLSTVFADNTIITFVTIPDLDNADISNKNIT